MHRDVHRFLDGELPRSALSPEAEAELVEWEELEPTLMQRRSEQAPARLVDDVMRALPAAPLAAPEPAWRRAWEWLVTPRPIRVPPFAPLAAAAGLALIMLTRGTAPDAVTTSAPPPDMMAAAPVIYVQFALEATDAQSVAVAGDFNDWSVDTGSLRDPDGDGVWSGLVAVQPGVHKYMFVVNGEDWVTDPVAESYVDDGFGMRNALLAVTPPVATS